MRKIRRILLALRSPDAHSASAVGKAVQLARAFDAELELLHVIAEPIFIDTLVWRQQSLSQVEQGLKVKAARKIERVAEQLRKQNLDVHASAVFDHPVHEAIVRHVAKTGADLVIADRHIGKRGAPWLMRFTDRELLRLCPVPVLVVKNSGRYTRPRVLAAVDPTHAYAKPAGLDREILLTGEAIAEALRGSLHAVHAFHAAVPLTGMAGMEGAVQFAEIEAESMERAQESFEQATRVVALPRTRRHIVHQHPHDAIPSLAKKLRAPLVVMGAVSRSGIKGMLIGNTAERLIDAVGADLLVVKPPRFSARVARKGRGAVLTTTPVMAPGAW